jgi:hypothetical protein
MKLKVFGFFFLLCAFLSSCASPGAKEAKIYQSNLETMLGKEKKEAITMINGWNFALLDSWQAENPDADVINKHNRPASSFSKNEIQEIFAPKGKYDVMLFLKKIGSESATTGQIDELGRGLLKDTEFTSEIFALIRTVFRDGNLVSYKIWPNVSSTSISGMKPSAVVTNK